MNKTFGVLLLLIAFVTLSGCGGGGGQSSPPDQPLTQKSALLSFALISSAQPQIESFNITLTLPPGTQVSTFTNSTFLNSTSLLSRNDVFVQGTYSAAIRRVKITGVKSGGLFGASSASRPSGNLKIADIVAIYCTIPGGSTTLSNSSFTYSLLGASLSGGNTTETDRTSDSLKTTTFGY